uniref:Protein kinase domain-containing protein n=1 Tax=Amphiprion percula TaxID=161767 RepID=A0A3P8SBF4_AMPPE
MSHNCDDQVAQLSLIPLTPTPGLSLTGAAACGSSSCMVLAAFTLKVSVISKLCKYHKMTNLGITEGCKLGSCHTVEDILGEGGFGLVAKCRNTQTKKTVAVKVNKGEEGVFQQAIEEIAILKQLRRLNPDTCNIVQWDGFFFDKERICLTFELLDQSLHQYLQEQNQYGLPMGELRPVLHQLATALSYVHSINIIHADLKPVNIMVVDRHQHPVRVKVIDFGLACPVSEAQQGMRLGTLWYRAPEMSLGVPLSQAFDMWALGLVMAELAMGCQLYPGRTDYDVLRFIVETQGQPSDDVLDHGLYTPKFFINSLDEIEKHMEQHPDRFMFVIRRPILSRPATRWMDADVSMASVDGSSVAQKHERTDRFMDTVLLLKKITKKTRQIVLLKKEHKRRIYRLKTYIIVGQAKASLNRQALSCFLEASTETI